MRISDWSSDVCSSDLGGRHRAIGPSVSAARCHLPMASPQGGSNDWYRPSASPARTIVAHVPMQPSPPPPVDPVSRGDRRHIMEWGFMTILGPILLAAVLAWA